MAAAMLTLSASATAQNNAQSDVQTDAQTDAKTETPGAMPDLVLAAALNPDATQKPRADWRLRGKGVYYTWIEQPPATVKFTISSGHIYQDRGDVNIRLRAAGEGSAETVAQTTVAPDTETHTVALQTDKAGLHELMIDDHMARSVVTWDSELPRAFPLRTDAGPAFFSRWDAWFYVPAGTSELTLRVQRAVDEAKVIGPDGAPEFDLSKKKGRVSINVPDGTAGRLWRIRDAAGRIELLSVPPYAAFTPQSLLLPKSIVDAAASDNGQTHD